MATMFESLWVSSTLLDTIYTEGILFESLWSSSTHFKYTVLLARLNTLSQFQTLTTAESTCSCSSVGQESL